MPRRIASQELCSKCKYRIWVEGKVACNYKSITCKSRIFVDGKMSYDPKYCNKFKQGDKEQEAWRDNFYLGSECDEYTDYKCTKIRQEEYGKDGRLFKKRMGRVKGTDV